jgi:signal transduction histidine kinase
MSQVIEEGRTAVGGLRSWQSASLSLEQAFSEIKNELAIDDEIQFRVIVDGLPQPLHPILRDEVYRIGREAVVNAFRHSRAKSIEVELDYTTRSFRFLVRDNGCGIAPEVVQSGREGHWGLPGMRERAERIGAQLHVWSSAASGTEVELSVPGSVAFQHESSARRRGWFGKRHSGRNGMGEIHE